MKCIILAGGAGERLWPVSRDLYPKSLLKLDGEKTLVQNVYELALSITNEKNIITITNIRQECDIRLQLKSLTKNPVIISEPAMKNTLAAAASGFTYLSGKKDETVIIMPVDFYIEDKKIFEDCIKKAVEISKKGYICAIGVKPSYCEEGFGYIQAGKKIKDAFKADKFIEKPLKEDIENFIKKGSYYWNTGIYVGKLSVFIKNYKEFAPFIIEKMSKSMFDDCLRIKYEYYANLPEQSIDYGIMEKSCDLTIIELKTNWYDLGSWQSIYNKHKKDIKNNATEGNVVLDKVKNSFVYSSKELVAVSGVQDKIIIETEDAVLVCAKDRAGDINKIVKKLKMNNDSLATISKTVFRPWGYYTCLNEGKGWLTKLINVSPNHKLSLQSHNHRSEHWVVLEGSADVILDDKIYTLQKGRSIDIPVKSKHSLQNNTNKPLKILEVQKGDYISEEDIIRYEDIYGRVDLKV